MSARQTRNALAYNKMEFKEWWEKWYYLHGNIVDYTNEDIRGVDSVAMIHRLGLNASITSHSPYVGVESAKDLPRKGSINFFVGIQLLFVHKHAFVP